MKAMVLLSGGVDSATCLALANQLYGKEHIICLSISYGQKHTKELEAAKNIIHYYGVESIALNLEEIFRMSDCSLLKHSKKEIPKVPYSNQIKESNGNPVSTYVPFRNGLFLSTAASIALSKDCDVIYYGAHMDDAAGNAYPDCSNEFYEAMAKAINEGSGKRLRLEAPFIKMNKSQVVAKGIKLNVPYELTWSCYEGSEEPCGTCATCIDRRKAFENNNRMDPAIKGEKKIKC